MSNIKLYQGDCLEVMKDIPAGSIDMICTDLPYGTTACAWDIVIPFEPLWEQYNRIIKNNGCVVLFGAEPFSTKLRMSNLNAYKYDWIWKKESSTGFLNAKKQPLRNIELISIFYYYQPTYNPQFTVGKPYTAQSRCGSVNKVYDNTAWGSFTMNANVRNDNDGFRYPTQLLEFNSVAHNYTVHPTQKPVDLLQYLIKTYTNEGDTVLDNCMGSGSTGVAAKILNRNFIGIELDEKYFKIAEERINNVEYGIFDTKSSTSNISNNRNKLF